MTGKKIFIHSLLACSALGSLPSVAFAQVDAEVIEDQTEIIVTATKRQERAIDVPISLTAVSGEQLEAQGISDIGAVIERTPNVSFTSEGGPLRSFVSIRGVQNLGGNVNVIGYYVDELNVGSGPSNRQINSAFLDIEQLTVLRGPQGTNFGRNTSGGAILVTTRKPSTTDFEGTIQAAYGSRNTIQLKGSVNIPVMADTIGLRLSAYNDQNDGFLRNITNPDNDDDERTYGGRAALRVTPSERLTVDLSASYTRTKTGFIRFVPNGNPYGELLANFGIPYPIPSYPAGFYPDHENEVAFNFDSGLFNSDLVFASNIRYEFDGFDLVSVTGWARNKNRETFDVDLSPADLFDRRVASNYTNYSTELRLQSTGDQRVNWLVGGIYFRERINDVQNDVVVGLDPDLGPIFNTTFDPAVAASPSRQLFFDSVTRASSEGFAIFANISGDVTDNLEARAGVRYGRTKISDRFFNGQTDFDPTSPTYLQAIYPEPRPGGLSTTFEDVSPSFALTYKFDENAAVYATVSKGFKEGGLQLRAEGSGLLPDALLAFEPEELWNYEAGIKASLLENKLSFNLSVFSMKWKNLQVSGFDPSSPLVLVTRNAARASSKGVEFDFVARPLAGLTLSGAVGYLDAKFDDYTDAQLGDGSIADVSGTRLIRTAKWSANANVRYEFDAGGALKPYLEADYIYQGNRYSGFEVESAFFVPAYNLVNLRLGAEFGPVSATLYADNVFGERYFTGITPSGGFTLVGNMVAVTDDKPQYGIRLKASF